MTVRQEDKEFIAKVYSFVFVGIMLDWINGDMKGDPGEIVERLGTVVQGGVSAALERMRTDRPLSK